MEKIGFIGLGIMGKPMAANLLKAGYAVTVYNTSKPSVNELVSLGAIAASSAKEVAQLSDVVISIVPDTPDVLDVALGTNGLIEGLKPGMLYIDMSTIAADASIKIEKVFAEKGVDTLDAPISGGETGAINASLSIMAGGSEAAFERARPIFEVLGKKITHMGKIGAGQITKSCNQIATALATQGVIEAFTLAKKSGVDLHKLREAMMSGFAQSRVLELAGKKMIDRDFTPGFKVKLYRKDLGLAQQSGRFLGVSLPGTSFVATEMDALIAQGKGENDFSSLVQIIETLSGLTQ